MRILPTALLLLALWMLPAHAKRKIEFFTTATTATILGGNRVGGVTLDSSGNHWFATFGAVSRYDGTSWKIFTVADGVPLGDPKAITTDPRGRVWVAYDFGGAYFDGTRFRKLAHATGWEPEFLGSIAFEGDSIAWVGLTGSSLLRCVDTACVEFGSSKGFRATQVRSVAVDHEGNLWIGTHQSGLWKYDGTVFTHCDSAVMGERMMHFQSVAVDARGTVWVGGNDGLRKLEKGVWSKVDLGRTGWTAGAVTKIVPAADSSVYIQQSSNWTWIIRIKDTALTTRDVGPLHSVDPDGTLWTQSFGHTTGVVSWRGATQTLYQTDGLGDNSVVAMVVDRQGRHWFATNAGVSRLDGNRWTSYGHAEGLPEKILAITEDPRGGIWLQDGNYNVYRDSANGFAHVSRSSGKILRWSIAGGTERITDDSFVKTRAIGASSWSDVVHIGHKIHASVVDRQGREWFGTEDGLLGYDSGLATPEGSKRMYVDSSIRSTAWPVLDLAVDSTSGLWVISQYGNLAHFDQGVWTYPLPDVRVSDVLVDRDGDLWVSGIWNKEDVFKIRHFGRTDTTDYLRPGDIPFGSNFQWVDAENNIWVSDTPGSYHSRGLLRLVAGDTATTATPRARRTVSASCMETGCRRLALGNADLSGDLDVVDLRGVVVLRARVSGGIADISRLPRGVYQVRLRSTSGISSRRFLKP